MSAGQAAPRLKPALWKYVLGALAALIILIPLWTVFVMVVIQPTSLTMQEQTMGNRLWWWVAGPATAITLLFGWRWMANAQQVQAREQQVTQVQAQHAALAGQASREYVLEVIGLGVTLDQYRQGKLWEALQKGSPYVTIREQDPKKYPWSEQERDGRAGGRGGDSLENGAKYIPRYWGTPVFNAEPPIHNPRLMDTPDRPHMGLAAGADLSGMIEHLFVAGPRRFEEHPDRLLEEVFAFFDAHPDVPYVVLNSDDDIYARDLYRAPGTPELAKDGYYIPEMPDASTLFVLARRERVDAIRPFVFEDVDQDKGVSSDELNRRGVARRLFLAYDDLGREVPVPKELKNVGRQPTIAEWLPTAAAFGQRPDIRGTGPASMFDNINPWAYHPPKDWKPTPWFPIPWNQEQLAAFDKLPTLGFIHRPTFVKFTDEHGKPLTRRDQRQKALREGWQEALRTLPEAERMKSPARIIAATGGNTERLIALHSVLNDYAAHGGPELTVGQPGHFIDTDKRLGNTGVTTLFMQMAIGVIGSYRAGGVSAAVNMRDGNEASIVFISPPPEEKRKTQKHPNGGDVFAHHGTPAIDPANYQ